jgi:hypothetical protein
MDKYSTHTISQTLLDEITNALKHVSPYGSVEIYVQDSTVTQITVRNIKKTIQTIKSTSQQNGKPGVTTRM